MNGASHAKRIEIESRDDPVLESKDRPIELGVMAQERRLCPVNLAEFFFHVVCEPTGLAVVDLDTDTNDLEPRVIDVLFSRHLRETEVLRIIRFKIECNETHRFLFLLILNLSFSCRKYLISSAHRFSN